MKIIYNGKQISAYHDNLITSRYEKVRQAIIFSLLLALGAVFILFWVHSTARAENNWDNATIDEHWVQSEFNKDDLGEINHAFFLGYDLGAMAEFTAKHEGFRECAYYDLGGGWSIGYGTVSYEGECITEPEARERLKFVLQAASEIVHGYTGVIPQDHMTALADTIFNVRPINYDYILRQYHHAERKRELTYALSKMTRACYKGECTVYGGLQKRFKERIDLLF